MEAGTLTVASNLSGADGLNITGNVILSGSNTYQGSTTVASGKLEVLSPGALPAGGSLIIGAGAGQIFGACVKGSSLDAGSLESLDLSSLSPAGLNGGDLTSLSAAAADSSAALSAASP